MAAITVTAYFFTTVIGSPAGSFWTVTDCKPGLSSMYGNVPLMLQVFSQSFDRHHQTQWYKWHLWTSHCTL